VLAASAGTWRRKARTLAGWKGYVTNLPPERGDADFVIGA
jgi:hypothetical protein